MSDKIKMKINTEKKKKIQRLYKIKIPSWNVIKILFRGLDNAYITIFFINTVHFTMCNSKIICTKRKSNKK